jgi:hypothetical protein
VLSAEIEHLLAWVSGIPPIIDPQSTGGARSG